MIVATGLFWGFDVWQGFLTETRPLMMAIMEAPYPRPYQSNALTVFFTARAAGFGLTPAYGLQAIATIAAIAAAVWLWLPGREVEHRERVVLTAVLAILATPYGYTYDTISIAVAVALLFTTVSRPPLYILALCWLFAYFAHILNHAGFCVGVLVPLFLAVWMLFFVWRRNHGAGTPEALSISSLPLVSAASATWRSFMSRHTSNSRTRMASLLSSVMPLLRGRPKRSDIAAAEDN
jgi:hypothetical protein